MTGVENKQEQEPDPELIFDDAGAGGDTVADAQLQEAKPVSSKEMWDCIHAHHERRRAVVEAFHGVASPFHRSMTRELAVLAKISDLVAFVADNESDIRTFIQTQRDKAPARSNVSKFTRRK